MCSFSDDVDDDDDDDDDDADHVGVNDDDDDECEHEMTVMMMVLMVMVSAMMLTMRMMVKQMMMSMTMGIRMLGCQCYSSTISHRYTSSTRQKSANKQIHLRTDSCIACVLIRCISEQVLALRVYYTVHKQTDSFLNRFLHYVFITRHTSKHIHFRTDSSLLHGTQGN